MVTIFGRPCPISTMRAHRPSPRQSRCFRSCAQANHGQVVFRDCHACIAATARTCHQSHFRGTYRYVLAVQSQWMPVMRCSRFSFRFRFGANRSSRRADRMVSLVPQPRHPTVGMVQLPVTELDPISVRAVCSQQHANLAHLFIFARAAGSCRRAVARRPRLLFQR